MTHPTLWHLIEHAGGSGSSGMRLLVATHLTFCPSCRSKLARIETIGGAFLASEPLPNDVAPPHLPALPRQGEEPFAETAPQGEAALLPGPIRHALGPQAASLPWRWRLPGLWDIRLPGDAGEDVRLLKGRPAVKIFTHTHAGDEATLVLAGQLRDGSHTFRPGEVSLCGPEDDHTPQVVGEVDCYCLLVLDGPLRFTGPMAPILNLLPQ